MHTARSTLSELGVAIEDRTELVLGEGPFFARVEDEREIAPRASSSASRRAQIITASPLFMSLAPEPKQRSPFDVRRPVLGAHRVEVTRPSHDVGPAARRVTGTTIELP